VQIEDVPWDHPDAELLRAQQRVEIAERYGTPNSEPGPAPTAADIAAFVIARDADGAAVACGGLRRLDATSGELKRMYVVPARRGSGVADAVLAALEARADAFGWTDLCLETGDRQPDAVAFYLRRGYAPIERFGPYVQSSSSLCYGRRL
jgi:GNAT superfamily N-acetyltransferase